MVRIANLKKENDIISFDYYCENKEQEKGFVSFNEKTNVLVENKLAPMEEKVGYELYQSIAIGYSKKMLKDNLKEQIFCWY